MVTFAAKIETVAPIKVYGPDSPAEERRAAHDAFDQYKKQLKLDSVPPVRTKKGLELCKANKAACKKFLKSTRGSLSDIPEQVQNDIVDGKFEADDDL